MVKAYLDLRSLLTVAEDRMTYFPFGKLVRDLREACGAECFYLVGDYGTRLTKLVVQDVQKHELGLKGIEVDTYDPVIERCADGGFAKELVKNVRLSDGCDSYIVVTADADAIPAIAAIQDTGVMIAMLMDHEHPAYAEASATFPMVTAVDITAHGPTLRDRICLKEIKNYLQWADAHEILPTRIAIVRNLERYSHISRDRTTFFLNSLTWRGILLEERHVTSDRVFFAVRIRDVDALASLAA